MEILEMLQAHGQGDLLRFYEELNEEQRARFTAQLKNIDWSLLEEIDKPERKNLGKIEPIEGMSVADIQARKDELEEAGKAAIRAGKVCAVLLAGGMGTRLGSSAPKGCYNIGLTRELYIFEQLVRNLQDSVKACGAGIPLLIMTSERNDAETRAFFEKHGYFGYPASLVRFFPQEMAICVGFDQKILLEEKGALALSPNGNGGWYSSLVKAGLLEDGLLKGVEWFNVFAVDNVLQRIADPVFVGAAILSGKQCGAKVVRKACPEERVGVLCLRGGLLDVIEYYELPKELAYLKDKAGNLLYSYGVILNYLFRAKTLKTLSGEKIPVHVVKKKAAHLDKAGNKVIPQSENAYKFETLILDMVRLSGSCLPFEVEREREFAPVKNLNGVDSVDTARVLLQKNGVDL